MSVNETNQAGRYRHVIHHVFETPWMILEGKLHEITDLVALRASGVELSREEVQARIGSRAARRDQQRAGSVAVIPIYGVITPKADLMSEMSGGTSVDRLKASLQDAVANPEVSSIVLDIDSPGGSAVMMPEMAREIRVARRQKPIVAVANTMAGSAAYYLASQANEVVVTPSGSVGSVGTIAAHEDISKLQESLGVKTTLISAGKFKGERSPFAPLSEEAKANIQAEVDHHYGMFVRDVARGRGVTVDTVKADFGQGRMLMAKDAVAAGLADRIDTLDNVVADLQARHASPVNVSSTASMGAVAFATSLERPTTTVEPIALAAGAEFYDGPIKPHSTATSDKPWDGPANKARLPNEDGEKQWLAAFAWFDDEAPDANGDHYPDRKGDYKFIHHEVDQAGDVHAANVNACSQGIAVLNGGRTGTTIPDSDRQGVWDHLAQHLRDAGREPPPLKSLTEITQVARSGLSFAQEAAELHANATDLVERLASLAEVRNEGRLTKAKREQLAACPRALREAADAIAGVLAATDPDRHGDAFKQTAGKVALAALRDAI